MIRYLEFSAVEFEDRNGITRTFYGCSIEGIFEFDERLVELQSIVDETDEAIALASLYRSNRRFRFLCDRCLALNGIDPDWVTLPMLEALLFPREEKGQVRQGWLIELNQPRQKSIEKDGAIKLGTKARLIAALALQNDSLSEALQIARSEPAQKMLEILEAKADLALPTEERKKQERKNWAAEERQKARERVKKRGKQQSQATTDVHSQGRESGRWGSESA